ERALEHALGPFRERDVPGACTLAGADDLQDLVAGGLDRDSLRAEGCHRDAVRLGEQTQEQVLGADVVVLEAPRFFLREDDDPSRPIGEELEHVASLARARLGLYRSVPIASSMMPGGRNGPTGKPLQADTFASITASCRRVATSSITP